MATILTKKSDTASAVPLAADLTNAAGGAELAVNATDKRLFSKTSGGTVVELGTNPTAMAVVGNTTVGGTLGVTGATTLAGVSATTLSASSTVTLSGGTANGVAYLNGSKVVTSGSALTFDGSKLTVARASNGDVAAFSNSSDADFLIKLNSGVSLLSPTTSILAFGVSNSEQMRLTSTGLGIGTSSPAAKLNVNGNALFNGTTKITSNAVEIQGDMALGNYSSYSTSNYRDILYSASTASFGNQPTAYIRFQTTSDIGSAILFATRSSAGDYAERLRLDQSGNLGLGVTPSAWLSTIAALQMKNGAAFYGQPSGSSGDAGMSANQYINTSGNRIYIANGYATFYDQKGDSGVHRWFNAPSGTAGNAITFTQAMTLDASGRLGVGTTSPSSLVHAAGASGTNCYYQIAQTGVESWTIGMASSSSALAFANSGTERARIDSSGNLLVGTTSTYGGPARINVGFNQSTNFGITLRNTSATATGVFVSFENSSGGGNGSISQTNSTTIAYNTSSDRRLKTNISLASSASSDIDAIQVVSHGWVSNNDIVKYGVIAQDLELVAPQAVTKGDNGEEIEKVWGVDYSKLVPMLIKEVQSLRKRLADAGL